MKERLKAIAQGVAAKRAEAQALLTKESPTAEDVAAAEGLIGEAEGLQRQYALLEKSGTIATWEGSTAPAPAVNPHPDTQTLADNVPDGVHAETRKRKVYPLHSPVKAFEGEDKVQKANDFGLWILGVAGNEEARRRCVGEGIVQNMGEFSGSRFKAQSEGTNSAGGALVPVQFLPDIIRLIEQYGVFRRNAKYWPMTSDTMVVPRRTGGLTVYYPGEGGSITESQVAYDNVELRATKFATLTKTSTELVEDSAIDIGNELALEIAHAFAKAEDTDGFLGDGTSTYGGLIGLKGRYDGLGTQANSLGVQTLTASGWSSHVLTDFEAMVGKVPVYADDESVKWYCHKTFFWTVMEKLALAAGGVTSIEIANGRRVPIFLGYPVEFVQVMPKATGTNYSCYLGNLAYAAAFGDRRQIAVAFSEHYAFSTDEVAFRATQRVDINVHDVGNNTSTAANQVVGPLIAGYTA